MCLPLPSHTAADPGQNLEPAPPNRQVQADNPPPKRQKGHGRTRQQRSSNRLMLSSAMVHGRPGRRRQALDASAAPAARRGAHMTGSAPSVAILKQFTCGSEAALAAASCSRLGDATISCRRPATTAPRGARARPNAAARASISGLGSSEQPLTVGFLDMTHFVLYTAGSVSPVKFWRDAARGGFHPGPGHCPAQQS